MWNENNLENEDGVWDLFSDGKTKGIFQLESNLGKSWARKLKPRNLEQLAALVTILRPGSLRAIIDDKSITQHYVDRRHNKEPIVYIDNSCKEILEYTLGLMLYQEQTMKIAQKIAGFSGVDADRLRKSIGKKDAALMEKLKDEFVNGCIKANIVTKQKAEEIFEIIEKSARYQFNASHAFAYAKTALLTAYVKYKHPLEFFTSYLEYSGEKPDKNKEVSELVAEARDFGIDIKMCEMTNIEDLYSCNKNNNTIYFGIKSVKSMTGKNGDSTIDAIKEFSKTYQNPSWMDILIHLSDEIVSTNFKALCTVGFFSKTGLSRTRCLYEYKIYKNINDKEKNWVKENYNSKSWKTLRDCLNDLMPTKNNGGGTNTVGRSSTIQNEINLLDKPPFELDKDDPNWIIDEEEKLMGCSISINKYVNGSEFISNINCSEAANTNNRKNLRLACTIVNINIHTIKKEGLNKDREMAFLTVSDGTGQLDSVVIFPDCKEEYRFSLFEGNDILLIGDIKDGSMIVKEIREIQE